MTHQRVLVAIADRLEQQGATRALALMAGLSPDELAILVQLEARPLSGLPAAPVPVQLRLLREVA